MKRRWLLDPRCKDGTFPFAWRAGADVAETFERVRREQAEAAQRAPQKVERLPQRKAKA